MANRVVGIVELTVMYDPDVASLDEVADAIGIMIDNAMSTPDLLDQVGNPDINGCEPQVCS